MTDDSPTISLKLDSSPETLTLVRGMLGGVAELLQLDPELLDDLKTAVSEACNNVVMHAYHGGSGPLWVCLYVEDDGIQVIVRDKGAGIPVLTPSDDRLQGVGIPIMRALAQQTAFRPLRDGDGTEVWMQFASRRDGRPLYKQPAAAAPEDGWGDRLDGDAIVSLSPVSLVGSVLGRLARAMAARARFSLDRFSDVYLVTDALAAHAVEAASAPRIAFGLATDTRRLELTIGPFRPGTSSGITDGDSSEVASALKLLSDELDVRAEEGAEALRVVMLDERLRAPASV
ncbi:MAG TPA: ATP-binding protein [Solirubrobacteraceae bacterium]|nr:ATP-binding protein [Solirubrobacteraceae bacterium]